MSLDSRRSGISFRDALLKHKRLQGCFTPQALEDLLNPATYTGLAADMVEQVARKPLSTPLHGAGEGAISTQGTLSQSQYVMEDM